MHLWDVFIHHWHFFLEPVVSYDSWRKKTTTTKQKELEINCVSFFPPSSFKILLLFAGVVVVWYSQSASGYLKLFLQHLLLATLYESAVKHSGLISSARVPYFRSKIYLYANSTLIVWYLTILDAPENFGLSFPIIILGSDPEHMTDTQSLFSGPQWTLFSKA